MMDLRHLALALTAAFGVASCSVDSRPGVDTAEQEMAAGHYDAARHICRTLVGDKGQEALSIDELCRISVVASQLADISDDDADIDMATLSMRAALQRDPDSVLVFVHSLGADGQSRSLFIRQLSRSQYPGTVDDETVMIDSIQ